MKIKNYQIDGIYKEDYPNFCDAYLSYAEDENGKELTEEQLEIWQEENKDEFYDMIIQYAYDYS
tara:strand:+ start:634 stop:825 length:192 start_codon:yes stop_codon:yes gene_type:complete